MGCESDAGDCVEADGGDDGGRMSGERRKETRENIKRLANYQEFWHRRDSR